MSNELRQKGMEKIIKQLEIDDQTVELIGRLVGLKKDPHVKEIIPIGNSLIEHDIYMEEKLSREEIINLIKNHGFPEADYIGEKKDPVQLNYKSLMLRFHQPGK